MVERARYGRAIHQLTEDAGGTEKVLYSEIAPEKYSDYLKCWALLTCNCHLHGHAERLRESTYVTVYENKMEISRPYMKGSTHIDRNTVIYFDRDLFMMNAGKAGCCSPSGTVGCCPTCNDRCGEAVVLYGEKKPCCDCLFSPCRTIAYFRPNTCKWCEKLPIRYRSILVDQSAIAKTGNGSESCGLWCILKTTVVFLVTFGAGKREWAMLWPIADADALTRAINEAKSTVREKLWQVETRSGFPIQDPAALAPVLPEMKR